MVLGGDIYYSNDGQIESLERVTKVHRRYIFANEHNSMMATVLVLDWRVTSMHFHIFVSRLVHILITNS